MGKIDVKSLETISLKEFLRDSGHIIIAGTTGSGKSVLLHNIIKSIKEIEYDEKIYFDSLSFPNSDSYDEKLKKALDRRDSFIPTFYLIDPKRVVFFAYKDYVQEMNSNAESGHYSYLFDDDFYQLYKSKNINTSDFTSIYAYDKKYAHGTASIEKAIDFAIDEMESRFEKAQEEWLSKSKDGPIYLVIDEYADLILKGNEELENNILRIAQFGKAANIHLIIATQSPSSNIINERIKANISDRICLRTVNSQESEIILDANGAELLPRYGTGIARKGGYNYILKIDDIDIKDVIKSFDLVKEFDKEC